MILKANINYPTYYYDIVKDQNYECDSFFSIDGTQYLRNTTIYHAISDPFIDGLLIFRNELAPNPSQQTQSIIKNLLKNLTQLTNPKQFLNYFFMVRCWKNFKDFEKNKYYSAHLVDCVGNSTDGFKIFDKYHQSYHVTEINEALDHFVFCFNLSH